MKKKTSPKHSPLHDRPLRYAGQSLQEQIDDKIADSLLFMVIPVLFIFLASIDWMRIFIKKNNNPWVSTILALLIVAYAAIRMRKNMREIALLKLGRDGEKIVAENLEELKKEDAVVLHDIVGDGFNLDHVVFSPHGIFLIETKTRSKRTRGNPTIVYDGKRILVDGIEPDRNPVGQARAQANWLEKILLSSTGKRFAVKPVIVFPGWYVEPNPKGLDVWVLNPKALPVFIQHEPITITDSDLHLAVFHITRYIRTSL